MQAVFSAKATLDITPLGIGIQIGLSVMLLEDLFVVNGVDPNAPCDSKKRTALFYAAQYGPLDLLELVIKYGGKIGYHGSKKYVTFLAVRTIGALPCRGKELPVGLRIGWMITVLLHSSNHWVVFILRHDVLNPR